MSGTPDPRVPLPHAVRAVLLQVDRRWRDLGVPAALRLDLLADLREDLHAAHLDGLLPHTVMGDDPVAFADEVAAAVGHPPPGAAAPTAPAGPQYGRLLACGAIGAAVAVTAALAVFLPVFGWMHDLVALAETTVYLGYLLYAAFFVAAVLLAVRWGMAAAERVPQTVARAAVLLPASALVSLPAAIAVGGVTGYSTAAPVVLTEFFLVLSGAAVALLVSRWWAVRPA